MPSPRTLSFVTALSAALAALSMANVAAAHSEYVQYIPNGGVKACANCHPNGNESALNPFGEDSLPQVNKPTTQWWPALQDLDSDGDGQSNKQELGDPCGEWLIGLDPGRTNDIANPGDPASLAVNPDVPACEGTGGSGGSTTTTTTGAATTTAAATVGAGGSSAGGQGGDDPSTGAGKADPQIATQGSCAIPATPGDSAGLFSIAAAFGLLLLARARKSTSK